MNNNTPKKRGKKASTEQMEAIINFISANNILISGKCHPLATSELEDTWKGLVEVLNNIDGARKDLKQWKCFLAEWKSKVRKKARQHKTALVKTGGGGFVNNELTEIENRLMRVSGWVSVTGCTDLPEEIDPGKAVVNNEEPLVTGEYTITDNGELVLQNEIVDPAIAELEEAGYDADDPPVKEAVPVVIKEAETLRSKKTPSKNMTAGGSSRMSKLEESTERYSKSTENLSAAVNNLADSMNVLAKAILQYTEVVLKK